MKVVSTDTALDPKTKTMRSKE